MKADSFIVTIHSTKAWSATADRQWLTIEPTSGLGDGYILVSTTIGKEDTAHMVVTTGSDSQTLMIARACDSLFNGTTWSGGKNTKKITLYKNNCVDITISSRLVSTQGNDVNTTSVYAVSYQTILPNIKIGTTSWQTVSETGMYQCQYDGNGTINKNESGEIFLTLGSNMVFCFIEEGVNLTDYWIDTLYLEKAKR